MPTKVAPKRLLIVEDEQMLREFYIELMRQQGYDVLQAVNGQEGLSMIMKEKPDLVILDLIMPIMDGKAMLHEVRRIPEFKNLPVIILTNAGDVDNVKETMQYDNANAFLIKSNVSPEKLIDTVKTLMHQSYI